MTFMEIASSSAVANCAAGVHASASGRLRLQQRSFVAFVRSKSAAPEREEQRQSRFEDSPYFMILLT
jgi:hypothetical protein